MILDELTEFSNFYGSFHNLVLAGGGNTSAKDGNTMYIKGSGTALATIKPEEFVRMDRTKLAEIFTKTYPDDDKEREALSLADLYASMEPGQEGKRPSVETTLHSLFEYKFVLHLHPTLVNGLTCSMNGKEICEKLFGDDVLWIEPCRPGYILAKICKDAMDAYKAKQGKSCDKILLANHGVFVAADTVPELGTKLKKICDAIENKVVQEPEFFDFFFCDKETTDIIYETLGGVVKNVLDVEPQMYTTNPEELMRPFTPDHIVYCKAYPLFVKSYKDIPEAVENYKAKYGYPPKVFIVYDTAIVVRGENENDCNTTMDFVCDASRIAVYSRSFGGPRYMSEELTDFIVNWEAEAYRSKKR